MVIAGEPRQASEGVDHHERVSRVGVENCMGLPEAANVAEDHSMKAAAAAEALRTAHPDDLPKDSMAAVHRFAAELVHTQQREEVGCFSELDHPTALESGATVHVGLQLEGLEDASAEEEQRRLGAAVACNCSPAAGRTAAAREREVLERAPTG